MRNGRRSDLLRLREIYTILTKPWENEEGEWLTPETMLWYAIQPEDNPIYKRRLLKSKAINGLWWMNEGQWTRFLWQGHQATILKSGQDPDRVLATRSFKPKGWLYIRECGEQIDIEGLSDIMRWDPVKKKSLGSGAEWLTVSITKETYKSLDEYLSPMEESCRHEHATFYAKDYDS